MNALAKEIEEENAEVAVREAARILIASIALHAILTNDAYRGLSIDEKGKGAVNAADAVIRALG